jgi:nitrogen regulatory protein PII
LQQSAAAMEHGEKGHLLDTAAKKNTPEIYRAGEYIVDFLLKLKIELVFPEDLLESLLAEVVRGAKTGKIGERKVFILEVDRAVAAGPTRNAKERFSKPEISAVNTRPAC